jgi:small-conductance mechanosensitive channel
MRRVQYVQFILTGFWTIVTLAILGIITGFSYKDVGLIFTSIFAVLGVALFAQWSILSNVTASVIVFFFFPYHVGDHVKIIDGEDTIEGIILEITLFHVILKYEDTHITYPNSLVFQKAVVIRKDKGAKML